MSGSPRAEAIVDKLTDDEASDLARAIDAWREERKNGDNLGELRSAIRRHMSRQAERLNLERGSGERRP